MKESYNEKPIIKGTLSEEEAHNLANMMRAKMGAFYWEDTNQNINGKDSSGMRKTEGIGLNSITSEDYKNALEEIEKLKMLAADETKTEEFVFHAKKFILAGGVGLTVMFGALVNAPLLLTPEGIKKFREVVKEAPQIADDAKRELKNLMEKGEKFGEKEKEGIKMSVE